MGNRTTRCFMTVMALNLDLKKIIRGRDAAMHLALIQVKIDLSLIIPHGRWLAWVASNTAFTVKPTFTRGTVIHDQNVDSIGRTHINNVEAHWWHAKAKPKRIMVFKE